MFRRRSRHPNFRNMQLVLEKKAPQRPVMFDFIIGADKEKLLTGKDYKTNTELDRVITTIRAFDSGGYDHAPIIVRGLDFKKTLGYHPDTRQTKSLNEGAAVIDSQSFSKHEWPKIEDCDFSIIQRAGQYMDRGMKMIPFSLDGILENTISTLGYESLCILLYDDPQLVADVFEQVGKRLVQYFEKCLEFDEVGAVLCNDDWGFSSQTMVPPKVLKDYVFPWYKQIAALAHEKGKYAILHSCGYYNEIIDDVIDYIQFDGRHSYEDKIIKVEDAYKDLNTRIAVLGGMDVDFLARSTPDEVYTRCKNMLMMSEESGGYALGSGNSVPDYVPNDNYLAMLKAGNEAY